MECDWEFISTLEAGGALVRNGISLGSDVLLLARCSLNKTNLGQSNPTRSQLQMALL